MSASYNCSQFENVLLRKTPKSMFQKMCRSQILYNQSSYYNCESYKNITFSCNNKMRKVSSKFHGVRRQLFYSTFSWMMNDWIYNILKIYLLNVKMQWLPGNRNISTVTTILATLLHTKTNTYTNTFLHNYKALASYIEPLTFII